MPLSTLDATPALIVVDLQRGIVANELAHDTGDIVARSARLAAAFRARGLPVVLVTADGVAPGRTDAAGFRGTFPVGFDDLADGLDAQPDDVRVVKQRWGAFTGTDLDATLHRRDVTQVVITGIATTAGVESTARHAHELGYHVVLVADAMTDRSLAGHDHSTSTVFPRLGEVTTSDEVLAALTS